MLNRKEYKNHHTIAFLTSFENSEEVETILSELYGLFTKFYNSIKEELPSEFQHTYDPKNRIPVISIGLYSLPLTYYADFYDNIFLNELIGNVERLSKLVEDTHFYSSLAFELSSFLEIIKDLKKLKESRVNPES